MNPNRLTKFLLAFALLSAQSVAQAEYLDAIELPALQTEAATQSLLLDITRVGDRIITVGERGHVLLSDDHGATWIQGQSPSRMQLNALTFVDDSVGWAVGEGGLIIRTDDGGKNWQRQYDDGLEGPFLDVLFRNNQEGFAVGVFNRMLHTDDGGESWDDWGEHVDNLDEWHLMAMAATGPSRDRIYIASEKGLVFRSTDQGESFEAIETGHQGTFHAIAARRGADGEDRIVMVGVGGVIYTSTDGGETWARIDSGTDLGLASVTWLDDGGLLAAGAGGVLVRLLPNLQQADTRYTQNGESLSALVQLDSNEALLVGFGGLHSFNFQ
ncbi:YCF48-related protein [Marinobacterium sp. YM272]|uniref:WD40/YVTN/BNR-like repeat-containing protein n=1 Tax=Marinobacterium sp. YM272 TaxID=3421654 RepID=UPI003D7FB90F